MTYTEPGRLKMLMTVCMILLQLAFSGCLHDPQGPPEPGTDMAVFKNAWEKLEAVYPLFLQKELNWVDIAEAYYDQATECTTTDELIQLTAVMIGEIEDPALLLFNTQSGDTVRTFTREYESNVDKDVLVGNYLSEMGFMGEVQGFGSCSPEIFPYIYFEHLPSQSTDSLAIYAYDEFIMACVELELPAIVIDLRMNPQYGQGGITGYSKLVMSRLMPRALVSAIYRIRIGPGYGMLTDLHPWIQPAGDAQFTGDVYLLVGGGCNHAAEDIAVNLSKFDNFYLVGDTTAGDITITGNLNLGTNSSWTMKYGFVTVLTHDHQWVQDVGIPPDIMIEAGPGDFAAGVDPVLEYVIGEMGGSR